MKEITRSTFEDFGNTDKVLEILELVSKELAGNYVVIGGLAVRTYAGKVRKLTPDLDFLVKPEVEEKVLSLFRLSRNTLCGSVWLVGNVDGVEVDFQVATKKFENGIIESAETFCVDDFFIKVAKPEHLILMKLGVLREKDEMDIALLLKRKELDLGKLLGLVKTHLPSEIDTLKQFVLMSKLVKE
ncbi:nucleotidyltransferase [Desulfurobacterium sp.]